MMKPHSIVLIALVFFLLYYPPVFMVNSLHIIGCLSWIYILCRKQSIIDNLNIQKIIKLYLFLILVTIYIFIIAMLNGNSYEILATFLYWMIDIIPACIVVTDMSLHRKYTEMDVLVLLLIVGSLQGLLSLIAFCYPEFKFLFVQQMIKYGYEETTLQLAEFRMYGVSSNLTFATPIAQSMLAMIALHLSIRRNLAFIIFVPLLLFSAIINARTSMIVILIGSLMVFLSIIKFDYKFVFRSIVIVSVSTIIVIYLLNIIEHNSTETYEWMEIGIDEIKQFTQGNITGYFTYLSDKDKYLLPSGVGLLFGEGSFLLGSKKYLLVSDIGWINDIWRGGIFCSIMIYLFFSNMLLQIYRHKGQYADLNKYISLLIFLILIVTNFKGPIFTSNEVITLLFIVYIFTIIRRPEEVFNSRVKMM